MRTEELMKTEVLVFGPQFLKALFILNLLIWCTVFVMSPLEASVVKNQCAALFTKVKSKIQTDEDLT